LIFQTLDDKSECVGIYSEGALHFHDLPTDLTKTWKYTGSVQDPDIDYAWLYCGGKKLEQVCPEELRKEFVDLQRTFKAYLLSFQIAKIDLNQNCFFDLVPTDFLLQFCEMRNRITEHVFNTHERPDNYDHLDRSYKLLHKIKYQKLNINVEGCRKLMTSSGHREDIRKLLNNRAHYVNYNLFGTVTGRLTTHKDSNPILTVKSMYRSLYKPNNDWLVSFDYNGAEVRTFLALCGQEQPQEDIHSWNMRNLYSGAVVDRDEAKVMFFSAFYNHNDMSLNGSIYNRNQVIEKYYDGTHVRTPLGRTILVDERRSFNYVIQSTTSDLTIDRACALDEALKDTDSNVAFIIHDEVVLDLKHEDRYLLPDLKQIFENNKMGKFMSNVKVGKNYGTMKGLEI